MIEKISNLIPDAFSVPLFGIDGKHWLIAIVLLYLIYWSLTALKKFLLSHGPSLLARLEPDWAAIVTETFNGTKKVFLWAVAALLASQVLEIGEKDATNVRRAFLVVCIWQIAVWGLRLINSSFSRYVESRVTDGGRVATMRAASFLVKLVLLVVLVLWGLDNFGVNIGALIAGLGIGGVAIALAVQNILSDLFASLTIVLDKPFVIGDSIVVGEFRGTIEHIGLKTTRLRSISGEQLVFSNNDLLQSRIRNFQRMNERRIVFTLGVLYGTPYEKLAGISALIKEIIEATPLTRFERAHFFQFGDSSLNFEIAYYVQSNQYIVYMETQEKINLEIFRRFQQEGLGFAFPSRSLYLESVPKSFLQPSGKPA